MDKHVSSTPSEIELTPISDLIEQEVIRKSQLHSNQKLTNEQRRHCCHLLVRLSTNPANQSRYNQLYQALNSSSFYEFWKKKRASIGTANLKPEKTRNNPNGRSDFMIYLGVWCANRAYGGFERQPGLDPSNYVHLASRVGYYPTIRTNVVKTAKDLFSYGSVDSQEHRQKK